MSSSVDAKEEKLQKLKDNAARSKSDWLELLETFHKERELRTAKIKTETGDTLLHMAVSSGKVWVVLDMVDIIVTEEKSQNKGQNDEQGNKVEGDGDVNAVLGAENEKHNTPLHLLVSMECVFHMFMNSGVTIDPLLIAKRNCLGETPLFMAALHGKREVFLWLHYEYMKSSGGVSSTDLAHIRRDNGDTILHCALEGGHIEVAIEIIHLYKEHLKGMMLSNKNDGLSPLHLLAIKPSAFESTDLPGQCLVAQLIYRCRFYDMEGSCWAMSAINTIVILLGILAALPLIPLLLADERSGHTSIELEPGF